MDWFRDWLEERIREEDGNESAVARRMRLPASYIHKWRNGREPSLSNCAKALDAYGFDLFLAQPGLLSPTPDGPEKTQDLLEWYKANGWKMPSEIAGHPAEPAAEYDTKTARLQRARSALHQSLARKRRRPPVVDTKALIQAGDTSLAYFDAACPEPMEVDENDPLWEFFDATLQNDRNFTTGPLMIFVVAGESMMPDYQPGCWILTRQPTSQMAIPDGWDVILEEIGPDADRSDRLVFKRLQRISDRERPLLVIGKALNPKYDDLQYRPEDVRIHSVVIGYLGFPAGKAYTAQKGAKGRAKEDTPTPRTLVLRDGNKGDD